MPKIVNKQNDTCIFDKFILYYDVKSEQFITFLWEREPMRGNSFVADCNRFNKIIVTGCDHLVDVAQEFG